jgi:hypothetical protein
MMFFKIQNYPKFRQKEKSDEGAGCRREENLTAVWHVLHVPELGHDWGTISE